MDDLRTLLDAQGGVVTHAQARHVGVAAGALVAPGEVGRLVRVRPDAYAEPERLEHLDDAGKAALVVAAERLVTGVDLVAIGLLAALVHGLPVLGAVPERPRLAERKAERPKHHGHSTTLTADDVVEVLGVPVTSLARTAVDVARTRSFPGGVITADAVLARGIDRAELEKVRELCCRWPGARRAAEVIRFADARSESALESYGRVRMHQAELPPPDLQVWLSDRNGVIGRVDQYFEAQRTVAEADGAVKYEELGALFAEKRREDRLRDAGFEVVRYTWEEIAYRPQVVIDRLLRAFARASRRPVA